MRRFALIGERLGHSLSVPIHRALYRELGVEAEYRLLEVPRNRLEERLPELLREVDGLNVTIPYKQRVMSLLREVDELAKEAGAVNTVLCAQQYGVNTDVAGFETMLRLAGLDPRGQVCFVLGTGGASGAVRTALRRMGAAGIVFVSRHPQGEAIGYDELPRRMSGLLVNCTPAGMWPHPEDCPIPPALLDAVLSRCSGVADLIYNPRETVLTRAARERGLPQCTGLSMLAAQAMEAERLWLGREIPEDLLPVLMKEAENA